jgi:beta-lactamase superfamily II metal-dependent hydrolase
VGSLTIHHLDVEQGDGALIITSGGSVAMIDNGRVNCAGTIAYIESQGVSHVDYHFATHYDADHIGCTDDLVNSGITIGACIDRGGSHDTATFNAYVQACGNARETASKGQIVALGGGVQIKVVDLNGAGVSTNDENALGLVLRLSYGMFDHEFAGDLPGESPDIESVIASAVGDVEVCKVHHHGSRFSSNNAWLEVVQPEVCILSVGSNGFGHPTLEAVGRLHAAGVDLYWTNVGAGVSPSGGDTICNGPVTIEATADGSYDVLC